MSILNIPDSWVPTQIGETCLLNVKEKLGDDLDIGFMPMKGLPTTYFGKCNFESRKWEKAKKGFTQFKDGDTIFAKITPCFENSKASVIEGFPNGWGAGSTEYYVLRPIAQLVDPKLLFGIVKSKDFLDNGAANMSGSVGHRRVPRDFVSNYPIGLPPLAEQKEITHQLDSLLAKVKNIKNRLDAIPNIIKRFRKSVLNSALRGDLFEECIKSKAVGKTLFEVSESSQVGIVRSAKDQYRNFKGEKFFPYLKMNNIDNEWGLSTDSMVYVKCTNEELNKYRLKKGDWLFNTRNSYELVGKSSVWNSDKEVVYNNNILRVRLNEGYLSEYVDIWFRSSKGAESLLNLASATTSVAAIYQKQLMNISIDFPNLDRQVMIVEGVKRYFDFTYRIEQKVNAAQERVNNLTQSILAKAFSGELTAEWRELNQTLITGENSAKALFAKIKVERDALSKKQSPKKKPVKKQTTARKAQD